MPCPCSFQKKEDAYTLQILKPEKLSSNEAVFEVTGYKPGQHNPEYIRITQGHSGFEFVKPSWEIKSVLKQNEPPKSIPHLAPGLSDFRCGF